MVLYGGHFHKWKSYGILVWGFGPIFYFWVIDSLAWFWMWSTCKSTQLMLVFLNLGPTPFQLYTYNLPDNAICDISIYADHTILSSKSD